jgi:hypothetical protein
VGAATGLSLVVILTSTLPVAYSSQGLFGVENQTYWFEYDAVKWFSEHGATSYTSDQRLRETGWRLFPAIGVHSTECEPDTSTCSGSRLNNS